MSKVILGFIIGVFLLTIFFFFFSPDTKLHRAIDSLMDKDALFLRNGSILYGQIEREGPKSFTVKTEDGEIEVPRAECQRVERNAILAYLRKVL